jgi:hypothetical protein
MDNKDRIEAGNALVNWFNFQEIPPHEAAAVMSKVMAKILVGSLKGPHNATQRRELDDLIDGATLQLVHDINDHIFATRR